MELVVRAVVMFVVVLVLTRLMGKRELAQMNALDIVVLVTLGDLVQQAVTQEDYSITGGILAAATFAICAVALSWVAYRFPRARRTLEGSPTVLIRDGELVQQVLKTERLTIDDVREEARQQGIRSFADVDLAVLEPSGAISFFRREENRETSAASGAAETARPDVT